MKILLRLEEEKDYRIVDELTREAFWNHHVPGCDEHLLIHNLRKTKEFVKELDFVAIYNNQIVGNIVYVKTMIKNNSIKHSVLTFGPVSVLPNYQNKGIGSKLINHTIDLSRKMGFIAIIIYGDPAYYKRFDFKESKHFRITDMDKKYPAALLVLELYQNSLKGIEGVFEEGNAYVVNRNELEEFDKGFVKKEKGYSPTQKRFKELSNKYL